MAISPSICTTIKAKIMIFYYLHVDSINGPQLKQVLSFCLFQKISYYKTFTYFLTSFLWSSLNSIILFNFLLSCLHLKIVLLLHFQKGCVLVSFFHLEKLASIVCRLFVLCQVFSWFSNMKHTNNTETKFISFFRYVYQGENQI